MTTSKWLKPHTPHPTPYTLSPLKDFLPQTLDRNLQGSGFIEKIPDKFPSAYRYELGG
ncbi:MAG: hypothetical protein GPJ13_15500 [Microcystis aeruginosa W11-06]|nr:hypothetical protein [Microcystis aeruginosa W11-03]NCR95095.1 hypothetical protein [Microcystis aeruginosa W11-06]